MSLEWGGWGKKTGDDAGVPDILKGKTPEQVAAELVRLSVALGEADSVKAELTQKTSELSEMTNRIKALEGVKPAVTRAPDATREPTSVLVDEEAAFNERLQPIVAGVLNVAAQTAKMTAESRIRQNPIHGRLLSKYQAEVQALYATVPQQYQQYPETYERIFQQVLGSHLDELLQEQAKGDGSLFTEGGGGQLPVETKSLELVLTADEMDIAKKMKITPEAMLASKKQMHNVGGHIVFSPASA